MKRVTLYLAAMAVLVLSASKCERPDLYLYTDSNGNRTSLLGKWGLTRIEYQTAGVMEARDIEPTSWMEFCEDHIGRNWTLATSSSNENPNGNGSSDNGNPTGNGSSDNGNTTGNGSADKGRTKEGALQKTGEFRYEKYRGAITLWTPEEWEHNRSRSEDDSDWERGRTYAFKVIDENTLSSTETVTDGTRLINIYTRRKEN